MYKLDFIEKMSDETNADRILKCALKEYFMSDNFDCFDLTPSAIVCDRVKFMVDAQLLKDASIVIDGKTIKLWDHIEPKWGDYCYCIFYPSNELKKLRLAYTFKK